MYWSECHADRDAKSGKYGRYISAIFLAGANFWAILGNFWAILEILGHFWAIFVNFGSFLGHFFVLIFLAKNVSLLFYHFLHLCPLVSDIGLFWANVK